MTAQSVFKEIKTNIRYLITWKTCFYLSYLCLAIVNREAALLSLL